VLAARLYSREQNSTLYTVDTASRAVEVSSTAGRAAIVKPELAIGRAARVCSFSCRQSSRGRVWYCRQSSRS